MKAGDVGFLPQVDTKWISIIKYGGISALLIVCIIPLQLIIFTLSPPPSTAVGFIELFHSNWLLGLLSLDLLYYVNNALLIVVYLGLFASLKELDFAKMSIALFVGMIGIAAYYTSAVGFEMLSVSQQYYLTDSSEIRMQLETVAIGLIERYKGTAFDVYYVFNAVTLLLFSVTMFRSPLYGKATAGWGLASGVCMLIPSTAGMIGMIFSIVSLLPWIVFSIFIARKQLAFVRQLAGYSS